MYTNQVYSAEFSTSDEMFQKASKAVKEKHYLEAINIFEKLAEDNESDAQYNLALLLKSGRGRPQNYKSSLKWAWLALLGSIEEANQLVDEIRDIMPDQTMRVIRAEVKNYIQTRAEKGNRSAIIQMGDYFLIVPEKPEYKNAYLWFVIAAAFQIEGSVMKREKVQQELEGKDILNIQTKALEIFEKISQTVD